MRQRSKTRFAAIIFALAGLVTLWAVAGAAQDDSNDVPLGDVARNLRKKSPAAQGVIDDDNFANALGQLESKHASGWSLKYLIAGDNKGFQVSSPDVTCSLSFSANAKALLSSQFSQMDLPATDIGKLRGPATIEGDALSVSLFNGTDWHVSEVAVAFTLIRKNAPASSAFGDGQASFSANPLPAIPDSPADAVRPEKKPDVTVIYHMRAAAPPLSRAVFSAPLNLRLTAGDEWHWAIVEAKGYPPETRGLEGQTEQSRAEPTVPAGEPATPPITSAPVQPVSPIPTSLSQPQ